MQPQQPTEIATLSGRWIHALFVLIALSLTVTPASALDGDVVSWPEATATVSRPDPDSIAFEATRSSQQLRLVDLSRATLPATVIDLEVDGPQSLRLEVYDLEGRHVRTLAQGLWADGEHRMAWHHETEDGELLEGGKYMVRLTAEANPVSEMALGR